MKNQYGITNSNKTIFLFFIYCVINFSESFAQSIEHRAEWPQITNATKPWTRFWWHGSAVNEIDLKINLEELKNCGIGGIEITPIYGVKGNEKNDLSFLSNKWFQIFEKSLEFGKEMDLGVDLSNASGWPFGGNWVTDEDACKEVKHKFYTLREGEFLNEKIEFIQEPFVRAVGHEVNIDQIKFPINRNENLQELALDQVRFATKLPLQTLNAYDKSGKKIELTNNVDNEGKLKWIAPKGEWKLIAVFQGWHGKMVERAGKGGEGNVIDHFSESSTKNFLNYFDKHSEGFDISGIRAFFNDSYEVDDSQGEADWTQLMFEEFKNYRGYDLKDYLPALFGYDTEENNKRVLCDYRETISDLLLDRFTYVWRNWSRKYNSIIRNQAHGSPANILDLYAASDIPETEGITPIRIKMASSAGHVTGKSLIACEASTWLNEHFLTKLSDVKNNIDRFFANGINHIVYHGTPYSPVNEKWPGWLFYASVHFAPTNTWWSDLKILNDYIANCQSFLQSSKQSNDILLYYPIYDSWSSKGSTMLQHFGGSKDTLIKEISELLLKEGYTFDFISDRQLQNLSLKDGKIYSGKSAYKTIIVPKSEFIPISTFEKLIDLAENGSNILFEDNMPTDISGMYNLKERQGLYSKLKSKLTFEKFKDYEACKFGKGKILKGKEIELLLDEVGVIPEALAKENLWFNKVEREDGTCYFISNWGNSEVNKWIKLNSTGKDAVWFNPMTKEIGKVLIRKISDKESEIFLKLDKGETLILQWFPNKQDLKFYPMYSSFVNQIEINGEWKIEFIKGGASLPNPIKISKLGSWTELSEELKWFSGSAKYSTEFTLNNLESEFYNLDLGGVHESAVIILNGENIGTLLGPKFNITISSDKLKYHNKLEVIVTNLMANRIIKMDKEGENYKKFYNINFAAGKKENLDSNGIFTAINWEPLSSGLVGPVILSTCKIIK